MESKDRLIAEALRLFALRGVDAVGVQEIVEASGVTKPTLYHHYGSKEGLIKAAIDQGFEALDLCLNSVGPYESDLPGYLERQAKAWLECLGEQPEWFRLQLSLVFLPGENPAASLVRPGVSALQERMEALFEAASQHHGNMRGRKALLAAGWIGALNHWSAIVLGGWTESNSDLIRAGTRQFLYGIFS